MTKKYIGIDYSMSSPALCLVQDDGPPCFYSVTDKKKIINNNISQRINFMMLDELFNIYGIKNTGSISKFHALSCWFSDIVGSNKPDVIFMEDYSMGSRNGRIFHIGENAGILKFKLYGLGYSEQENNLILLSPSIIKKEFSGKGNSDKIKMCDAYTDREFIDDMKKGGCLYGKSPMSDIVDSYACIYTGLKGILNE